MEEKTSLAQCGYEAYLAEMRTHRRDQRPWRELAQAERDAWAMASAAIIEGWEVMHDPPHDA